MTENHKQKGVLERVFAVSPKGKGLLAASCIASVLGMVLSLAPYLSVYFICKYFLLGAAGGDGGFVLWAAGAGGAGTTVPPPRRARNRTAYSSASSSRALARDSSTEMERS